MAEDLAARAIELHRKNQGKLEIKSKVDASTSRGLSLAYTPGVAAVCREIGRDPSLAYELTLKGNSVAVVSDGTRVLGLGNIGPLAGIPVMEGKAILFKAYAGIDAFPICLSCKSADEIVAAVKAISPVFGGINLEDIESPKCFEVEDRLKAELDIPVFHDDQHGTAVVVLAGLINALKAAGKEKRGAKIVVAGAAGCAIAKLLIADGFSDVCVCDSRGILADAEGMAPYKRKLAKLTNKRGKTGTLAEAMAGADALIGLSSPNIVSAEMAESMADSPIIFALSNPVPEIDPGLAKKAGVAVFGTARADLPNQINNVLGFPGIFRGALDVRARQINERMKLAAAYALAGVVGESELSADFVLPYAYDRRVVPAVSLSVAQSAIKTGVARLKKSEGELRAGLSGRGLL